MNKNKFTSEKTKKIKEKDTLGSNLMMLIEGVGEKIHKIIDHYSSSDHRKLMVSNILSKRLINEANIQELGIKDDLSINDLLLRIANNTVVLSNIKNDEGYTKNLSKISFDNLEKYGITKEDFQEQIDEFKNKTKIKRKIECLGMGKINPNEESLLDDEIFNHLKGEYKEDFLWYVMENYGNYHLSRLIFDHFIDAHKKRFKIYNRIFYTTEIHRFLFEVVKNRKITLKQAFDLILGGIKDIHELNALHILVHELKDNDYNSTNIVDVIDTSLNIIKTLREQYPVSSIIQKGQALLGGPKTQFIEGDNFRIILEHIQIDKKKINVENIVEYGRKNRLHIYKGPGVAPMYEKIFIKKKVKNTSEKDQQDSSSENKNQSNFSKFIAKILSNLSVGLSKKVLSWGPKISKHLNRFNFSIRSLKFFYKEEQKVKEGELPFKNEASLFMLQFLQQFQGEIERNVQSYKDELNGVPPGKIQKVIMKITSTKGLEESLKLLSFSKKGSTLYYMIFIKLYAKVLIAAGFILMKLFVKSDLYKEWRVVTGVKKGIRFKITYVLKNYLIANIEELFQISELESEKFYLETVLNKYENFSLEDSSDLDNLDKLSIITEKIRNLNAEEHYKNIEQFVKDSIELQSKTFYDTIEGQRQEETLRQK